MLKFFGLRKAVNTEREADKATFKFVTFAMVGIVFGLPFIEQRIEAVQDGSNWITPVFSVSYVNDEVSVLYRVKAKKAVNATFKLQVRGADNSVLCTYTSPETYLYSPNLNVAKPWPWHSWAEVAREGSCRPPVPPALVCLRYSGYTARHKTAFDTPWTCEPFLEE